MDHSYISKEPKLRKSSRICCVPQCDNRGGTGFTFHQFPRDVQLRSQWQCALKMGKPASNFMRVCSEHFQTSDFAPSVHGKKSHKLLRKTVPSLKLPVRTHDRKETSEQKSQRQKRAERSRIRETKRFNLTLNRKSKETASDLHNSNSEQHPVTQDDIASTCPINSSEEEAQPSPRCQVDKSMQTEKIVTLEENAKGKPPAVTLVEILCDDTKLKNFSGLHSFELLNALVECVSDLEKKQGARPKEMALRDRVLLVFVKLKLNLSFTSLAILFNINNRQTCVKYFKSLMPQLAAVLQTVIPWPDQDEVRSNLPIAFQNFRNTRVVLDCAETPIERSKCLRCRILTYSNYKGRHTGKFDVGVAPSGLITHISEAYGGRASDKLIVNHSGILNKLNFQDAVMVDKGFKIEEECLKNHLILYRPPFVVQKKQLSRAEALRCAEIARARVHVERVIQRIREFQFMKETVPWELLPYFNNALVIVAGIVNLSAPVLNVDKFL